MSLNFKLFCLLLLFIATGAVGNATLWTSYSSTQHTRLKQWMNAMANAKKSISIKPKINASSEVTHSIPNEIQRLEYDKRFVLTKNLTSTLKPFKSNNLAARQKEGAFCRRSFDGRSGYCILAYQCLHVIKEFRLHGTNIDICTYRKSLPVVCCPLAEKHVDNLRISAQKCMKYDQSLKTVKLDVPRSFSGRQCVSSIPMIVGGEATQAAEYPHMAALGWTEPIGIKWGCGGILISDKFVLTAAHCTTFGDKPPDMVRLGVHNLNNSSSNQQQDIKILLIILHPKYQTSLYYHDVALLKLNRRAYLSQTVRPACLWQWPEFPMQSVTAVGWGKTEFLGDGSDVLQKVDLLLILQEECKKIYKKERRLPQGILEGQFCAGHLEGGKDTCQGDSGGPLLVQLPELNCAQFIVGITSFGKFCALANAPGVYTKISAYLDWIENVAFQN